MNVLKGINFLGNMTLRFLISILVEFINENVDFKQIIESNNALTL